jgi:hypothetical protein
LNFPRKWFPVFLQENFISEIFNAYDHIRTIHNHYNNKQLSSGFASSVEGTIKILLEGSMSELRLMITALASITGSFFVDDSEKVALCSYIVERVIPLLNNSVLGNEDTGPTNNSGEDLKSLECLHFGSVILRLLGNFRLSVACRMRPALFEGLLASIGGVTFKLSEGLCVFTLKYT